MTFEVVISDLDDTLFDTSETLIPQALRETFAMLIESGLQARPADLDRLREQHPRLTGDTIFEMALAKFPLRPRAISKSKNELRALAREVYYNRPVPTSLAPFPKVREWLQECKKKGLPVTLVTSGDKYTQEKKVDALGLGAFFRSIVVVEARGALSKLPALTDLLERHKMQPARALCLGNRLDDEIAAGLKTGMTTCWMDRGEQGPIDLPQAPHYTVRSFEEFYQRWPLMQPKSL
jgi:putative hydrolase of the HAD superfamily